MKRNDKQEEQGEKEKEDERESPKKEKIDWAARYGLSDRSLRREVGFILGISCYEDHVGVAIYRSPPMGSQLPREDGFDAIDLMFSGKLEITRGEDGRIWNWRPLVNSMQMHHPNHFGPQRGLVIADMIRLLSLELISIEETFRKNFSIKN